MPEVGITRTEIINRLNLSLHGDLAAYVPIIGSACQQDPDFLAHLIAYDFLNGQIKDSKIALPVITLASRDFPDELLENSLAHLAMQPPRELAKSLEFAITLGAPARRQRRFEAMIRRYLAFKETDAGKWSRLAARHRRSLKTLYTKTHCPMPEWASRVLFGFKRGPGGKDDRIPLGGYVPGSIFADIAGLSNMPPAQIASVIQKWHISPLVVSGAMAGAKAKQADSSVVAATMDQMSDTETITRAASLERQGLSRDAGLKEKFRKKVAKATKSQKATLKTSVAAEEVEDEGLKTMLRELQERQIQTQKDAGRGIDGNWLVIVDRSQSQDIAIELGAHIGAAIAKFVTGKVWLVFCNTDVTPVEVTGLPLETIKAKTKYITAAGSTSYGVGLAWAIEKGLDLDGVAIVGDGGENSLPFFADAHREYTKRKDKALPVYFYQTYCDPRYAASPGGNPQNFAALMNGSPYSLYHGGWSSAPSKPPIQFTAFDLTSGKIDYFSIPNLVTSMSASRFGVVEKILACSLITLEMVLPQPAAIGR